MTDEHDDHQFSEGEGFDDPYEGFDLDPPELSVDPGQVDPVDSRVIADTLDRLAMVRRFRDDGCVDRVHLPGFDV
mgnify:CR=1 FL=1